MGFLAFCCVVAAWVCCAFGVVSGWTAGLITWLVAIAGIFYWRWYLSVKTLGPNEVGIMLYFGEPREDIVYRSGRVFVPWVPIRWDGRHPWELVRIPTKLYKLSYEGKESGEEEHSIWSSDHQLLFPRVTLYMQFPYRHGPSLVDMIQRDVPFADEAKLTKWAEEVIIPALRKVLKRLPYKEALGTGKEESISSEVNAFLKSPGSIFLRAGIYGEDPNVDDEGTGYARLEVEQIRATKAVEEALAAPAIAEEQAKAADHQAKASAALFSDTSQALKAWVEEQRAAGSPPTQAQIDAKQEELRQRALAKTAGYQQVHIKGLENATTAVVGGGGGAGVLLGGGGKKGPGAAWKEKFKKP